MKWTNILKDTTCQKNTQEETDNLHRFIPIREIESKTSKRNNTKGYSLDRKPKNGV